MTDAYSQSGLPLAILGRLQAPPAVQSAGVGRELAVDGLRGMCAGLVVYAHALAPIPVVDPRYAPPPEFYWFDLGSAAVLMFFVLSGYVIGLTVSGPASAPNISRYLRRRTWRLVPITYAAVGLTCLLSATWEWRSIVGHLLFLQNNFAYPGMGAFPLFALNQNLWSLHFEAVYYLGFLLVWRFAPRIAPLGLVLLLLGSGSSLFYWPVPSAITRYACGALFWFGGLAVAWHVPVDLPAGEETRTNWPSAMLTAYALWVIAPLRTWFLQRGVNDFVLPTAVLPHRLDFLPPCLWIMLAVSGRGQRLQRWFAVGCLAWAWVGTLASVATDGWTAARVVAVTALVIASVIARRSFPLARLARLAPIGGISFALYVFAEPLQLWQKNHFTGFSGSAFTYLGRLAVFLVVVVVLSWLVERRLQPWLTARARVGP